MLVAGLSIVGALLAWWASSEFSLASSLSQQALQEATQYQTVKAEQDGYVAFGPACQRPTASTPSQRATSTSKPQPPGEPVRTIPRSNWRLRRG